MSLLDDINREIEKKKIPKWNILKNIAEVEIKKMIDVGIPITRQIELLLKHNIVNKLERKEYTQIIKKHFGYKEKSRIQNNIKPKINQKKDIKIDKPPVVLRTREQSIHTQKKSSSEDKLSINVDLMSTFLDKKAKEKK